MNLYYILIEVHNKRLFLKVAFAKLVDASREAHRRTVKYRQDGVRVTIRVMRVVEVCNG